MGGAPTPIHYMYDLFCCVLLPSLLSCQVLTTWCARVAVLLLLLLLMVGGSAAGGGSDGVSAAVSAGGGGRGQCS